MELKTIYEDRHYIAVLKPTGVLSQCDNGEDLTSFFDSDVHIINRLDRPVGGIVLFAKDKEAAAKISALLQSGGIAKKYLAVTDGECADKGTFVDYLAVNQRLNLTKVVNKGMPNAKQARLSYRRLMSADGLSLVEVTLETGRHHQIRAQLAYHNMPVWGDTKYNPSFRHKRGVIPQLFACELSFVHPYDNITVAIKAYPDYGKFLLFTEAFK